MSRALPRDALAGAALIASSLFFLIAGWRLDFGTFDYMGPGFVPLTLSMALLCIGAILTVRAFLTDNQSRFSLPGLKPIAMIFLAVVLFVLLLRPAGYIFACAAMVAIAGSAAPDRRWIEVVVAAVVLPLLSALAFIVMLGVPMPLWPEGL